MTTITATFRVTTPMFLGGAQPTAPAQLREPSFKGVLRFWWRACAWSTFDGDLTAIHDAEQRVFGGPATGQSLVRLRILGDPPRSVTPPTVLAEARTAEGARYLGYGLLETAGSKKKGTQTGQLVRSCLDAPFDLTVELRTRLDGPELSRLLLSLQAMGTIGGLGGRSRRGFGSLALASLDIDGASVDTARAATDLITIRNDLLRQPAHGQPRYTALSAASRILVGPSADSAMRALDQLGTLYKGFRQGPPREHGPAGRRPPRPEEDFVRLAGFGLPINLGEHKPVLRPGDPDHDRRASPLFFHVHAHGDRYVPVVAFLPATFLPEPMLVRSGGGRADRRFPLPDDDEVFRPVRSFLDTLAQQGFKEEPR